ncbi:MAG: DUF3817 domain-containing protein [Flavobacteriales bacterium]|jgi:integral membrane protein|nr:DUF3817 domain-containing protein [Flavobacteriales bacterium]MCW8913707.1 DUF3817 domain-containing protein [Flavobacteriales bacterium]MCW8937879.1 DUF3817 domain-containing protein [Flavobacteriales bacterium]MCW8940544.1 DUF3817 domain-containing protein [Flavobacteriales bacterium]MCW8967311.1 DUF3817 domain-containing protein [Flavobacteriales bacterium]
MNSLFLLRIIAFLEGLSYLALLFIAMPIKYFYDKPEAVKHTGMAHGVLFVAYVVVLLIVHVEYKWKIQQSFWAFVASLVPFGTFYADKKWFRQTSI